MNYLIPLDNSAQNIFHEIDKAVQNNFISTKRAEFLYEEINVLFLELVQYYNHKTSTSISKKCFDRIWKTLNYMFIHGFHELSNNYRVLKEKSIRFFFDKGVIVVEQDIKSIEMILNQMNASRLPIHNDRYLSIIDEQIPNFLQTVQGYNALFFYCHVEEDLDYPLIDGLALYNDMYRLQGSDLVLHYLKRYYLEHCFCCYFKTDLPLLITQYEILKGIDIQFLGINLYELIMNQVIANTILEHPMTTFLSKDEVCIVKSILKQSCVSDIIDASIEDIAKEFPLKINHYIHEYKDIFILNFENLMRYDTDLLIYENPYEVNDVILLNIAGDNRQFLTMLSQIKSLPLCEKIDYLKTKVVSVYDLIDLLEADIFFNEEYAYYYERLTPQEIAIILQVIHPTMSAFHQEVHLDESLFQDIDLTQNWFQYLKVYLSEMKDITRIQEIECALSIHLIF